MTDIQRAIKFAGSEIKSLELAPEINGCEMTERLKEQAEVYTDSAEDVFILAVGISKIDNLLNELVGDDNA